jgi:hypothetical protein
MKKKEHVDKCKSRQFLYPPSERNERPDGYDKLGEEECDCDGYHTFDELYEHRIELFVALCRMRANVVDGPDGDPFFDDVWCSKYHSDSTSWEGWFILGIGQGKGEQITYHLPMSRWDEVVDFAQTLDIAPEFDGHTSDDVLERLKNL